ncbi:MAG: GTP-binding protein [Actinomycetia bacterium]|nr:GTP-binding protein [Actinomycetes bacterium]
MGEPSNGLLKLITCGSVDDGKSTLIGHILYDAKLLYADQEQALMLDSQVGNRGGSIDYSLLLDGLMAEREQGITIDVAYRYFTTAARSFIVADTPGHEEYTRNMAVGASFADLAVILIDASQGVLAQTRRHARICALMGIRFFAFAVNKMDLIGYQQRAFQSVSDEVEALAAELELQNVAIFPVSATEGDNVTVASPNMPWYNGQTLLGHLESVDISGAAPEVGFYLPIQRVSRPNQSFRGFQGQIECGQVKVGDTLTALPSGQMALVKAVFIGERAMQAAAAGQAVTVQLDREVDVSRGCVLERNSGLRIAKEFLATLLWMDDQDLVSGKDYWVKVGTKLLPAIVTGIRHKVDINNGKLLPVDSVAKNEIVLCEVVLSEPVVLDAFRLHKTLGELILIDRVSHATSACGVIESVGEDDDGGVLLQDGGLKLHIQLFDSFYYHPDIHTVLRHSPPPVTYFKGDTLPLQSVGYCYPSDFDLVGNNLTANIRQSKFIGFAAPSLDLPLLDANGLELGAGQPRDFGKYRRVSVWETDYEI